MIGFRSMELQKEYLCRCRLRRQGGLPRPDYTPDRYRLEPGAKHPRIFKIAGLIKYFYLYANEHIIIPAGCSVTVKTGVSFNKTGGCNYNIQLYNVDELKTQGVILENCEYPANYNCEIEIVLHNKKYEVFDFDFTNNSVFRENKIQIRVENNDIEINRGDKIAELKFIK